MPATREDPIPDSERQDLEVPPDTGSANTSGPRGRLFPQRCRPQTGPAPGERFRRGTASLHFGLAEDCYAGWPAPVCLISDGPYGVDGFPGDCRTAEALADWYEPHVRVWSARSTPATTLWFWNTEIGWANVHPLLREYGWEYRCCNIWDKGIGHIAGNANTKTLRKFPIVTEVCVHYVKAARFTIGERTATMQEWLRSEWRRTGLPLRTANDACEVSNAATRKYLTADHPWYYPPVEAFARLVAYANEHGRAAGRPFFSVDGRRPRSGREWAALRAKFSCAVGITNVWREPQVGGAERIQGSRNGMKYRFRSLHGSQKPLRLIEGGLPVSRLRLPRTIRPMLRTDRTLRPRRILVRLAFLLALGSSCRLSPAGSPPVDSGRDPPAGPSGSRLVAAARAGDVASVLALLDAGVPPDAAQPDGAGPLHWAAHRGDLPVADLLLHAGAREWSPC